MEKTRTVRTLTDKGWIVKDVPIDAPSPAPRAVHAPPVSAGPRPEAMSPEDLAENVSREILERTLGKFGLMAVSIEDYEAMQARLQELEAQIDHVAAGGKSAEASTEETRAKKERTKAEIKDAIAEAKDLDELTDIMKDVKDKALLKLADARAEDLKAKEQS